MSVEHLRKSTATGFEARNRVYMMYKRDNLMSETRNKSLL